MTTFRSAPQRAIDRAHSEIADCESMLAHSFTDADKKTAGDALLAAQDSLSRAVRMRDAWYAVERGDYESWDEFAAGFESLI